MKNDVCLHAVDHSICSSDLFLVWTQIDYANLYDKDWDEFIGRDWILQSHIPGSMSPSESLWSNKTHWRFLFSSGTRKSNVFARIILTLTFVDLFGRIHSYSLGQQHLQHASLRQVSIPRSLHPPNYHHHQLTSTPPVSMNMTSRMNSHQRHHHQPCYHQHHHHHHHHHHHDSPPHPSRRCFKRIFCPSHSRSQKGMILMWEWERASERAKK